MTTHGRRLPMELVCIRHALSIGNKAGKLSRAGDQSMYTPAFRSIRSDFWRVAPEALGDAARAGRFIEKVIRPHFTVYLTSPLTRTIETAGNLALPDARWGIEPLIREREWGPMGELSPAEAYERYAVVLSGYIGNEFDWTPPGGESVRDMTTHRVTPLLDGLNRRWEEDEPSVVLCSHNTYLWALCAKLEGMTPQVFTEWVNSPDPRRRMQNLRVIHYSRREPGSGLVDGVFRWTRQFHPLDLTRSTNEWVEIENPFVPNVIAPEWVRPPRLWSNGELIDEAGEQPNPFG